MSEEPVIARHFVEDAIRGELEHWMVAEADRFSALDIDGAPKPLAPRIVIPGNATVGLGNLDIPAPSAQKLTPDKRVFLRMWFSEDEDYSAETVAAVTQSLRWTSAVLTFTCCGNQAGITHRFAMHQDNALMVGNLLQAAYPLAHIEIEADDGGLVRELRARERDAFLCRDLLPPIPFWGFFEKGGIECNALYSTLMSLDTHHYAIYQVVMIPLPAAWSSVTRILAKTEALAAERVRSHRGWGFSEDAWVKADAKLAGPLYGTCIRVGLFTSEAGGAGAILDSLVLGLAGLKFSGGSLELIDDAALTTAGVTAVSLRESFLDGTVYHHGLILSPAEMALVLQLPSGERIKNTFFRFDRVPEFVAGLSQECGVFLANEIVFGKQMPVIWPDSRRSQHMVVTGASGHGKTVFVSGLAAGIVNRKHDEGLAIIDPHDTAISRFLQYIDEARIEDCILHDPMDEEYVLCLPLFDCPDPDQIDTAVSNVTDQIRALFSRVDMGHNIERGIRSLVRTVFLVPNMTLWDARRLLDATARGEELRERTCAELEDEMLIDYWKSDFPSLDRGGLARIRSRLDHILEPRRLRTLLMNRLRKISHLDVEEKGLILLARTSPAAAGTDQASIVDSLHLNGLQTAAGVRKGREGHRSIFTIIADEFGNYSNPRTVPHALRTLRKYDVSEILITQNIDSLPDDVKVALSNVNTHVVFQQGWEDAHHYFKSFGGLVPAQRFLMKNIGEGYARVGTRLAAIKCPLPKSRRGVDIIEEVRRNTREKYCVPRSEFCERMVDEHHVSIEDMKELDVI